MKAVRLQLATRTLANPRSPQWSKVPAQSFSLSGTPLEAQPSRYIRTVWAGKQIGAVRRLEARAAHNGRDLFFHLAWPDPAEDRGYGGGDVFPDAAAVIFPAGGEAAVPTVGSTDHPVQLWYWRADVNNGGRALLSHGLAAEEEIAGARVLAAGVWADGLWQAVIGRSMDLASDGRLRPGAQRVAFAVWEGSSQERGSLFSHTRGWQELAIE
jgi:DMSO reductase family type II enzyme heme b subunit